MTIHQFKITLQHVQPHVWRRIQVPSKYSFWDLHVAIQDAMGWHDSHLHEFIIPKKGGKELKAGIAFEDDVRDLNERPLPGWQHAIADHFSLSGGYSADYLYDFGDGWRHVVELEAILRPDDGARYPRCIDGERACPPEDCGGPPGYERLLDIISDAKHPEYEEMYRWLRKAKGIRGKFWPERFISGGVRFDDPAKRWAVAFRRDRH